MKIGFLLYPTARVKVDEDSSFWIMHELALRGHRVFHFQSEELFWSAGSPRAYLTKSLTHSKKGFLPARRSEAPVPLAELDVIFIRKEPPFDNAYLYSLQLLNLVRDKVFVLNDPAGIAMCNEKLFILTFKEWIPETFVTDNPALAIQFVRKLPKQAVIKPLNNKGGSGIFITSRYDRNLPSLLDQATALGKEKVMVQRYLPENEKGDKRILLLSGKPVGAFFRKPTRRDFRANLSVGGSMQKASITAQDDKIIAALEDPLRANGLHFVGIDVIGGRLSEINVTSPSGIPEIRALTGKFLEKNVADFIERRVL